MTVVTENRPANDIAAQEVAAIEALFSKQKNYFYTGVTLPVKFRIEA